MVRYLSGVTSNIFFGIEEDTLWDGAADAHKVPDNEDMYQFGQGVDFSVTSSNNFERIHGVGQRNFQDAYSGGYTIDYSVNGTLNNAWIMAAVLGGTVATASGTHTYSEGDDRKSVTLYAVTGSESRDIGGCTINKMSISASAGEAVQFTLDGSARYEKIRAAARSDSNLNVENRRVMEFTQAKIELPNGTTLTGIKSFSLDITNNYKSEFVIGSRTKDVNIPFEREYEMKMDMYYSDYTKLKSYFYAGNNTATAPVLTASPASIPTLKVTCSFGTAEIITFNFGTVLLSDYDQSEKVSDYVMSDVTFFMKECTSITYKTASNLDAPS